MMPSVSRIVALASLAAALAGCQTVDQPGAGGISSYGFSRNIPPSTLYQPGSLVVRRDYNQNDDRMAQVRLGYLCANRYSVALYPNPPATSASDAQGSNTLRGGNFTLDLPALKSLFNVSLSAGVTETAVASITDTRILAYAADELQEIRALLGPVCRSLVKDNIRTGNAWQVEQVLEASVDVTVTLKANASAGVKSAAVKQLINAGFSAEAGSTFTTKGKALYYGVNLIRITKL